MGDGRGQVSVLGRSHTAPRISWMIHHGLIPDGICVLHKCDTPECTNPDHLMLGTQLDNIADCVRKNRQTSGVRHPAHMAKIKTKNSP